MTKLTLESKAIDQLCYVVCRVPNPCVHFWCPTQIFWLTQIHSSHPPARAHSLIPDASSPPFIGFVDESQKKNHIRV
jgi:hypothetical protein